MTAYSLPPKPHQVRPKLLITPCSESLTKFFTLCYVCVTKSEPNYWLLCSASLTKSERCYNVLSALNQTTGYFVLQASPNFNPLLWWVTKSEPNYWLLCSESLTKFELFIMTCYQVWTKLPVTLFCKPHQVWTLCYDESPSLNQTTGYFVLQASPSLNSLLGWVTKSEPNYWLLCYVSLTTFTPIHAYFLTCTSHQIWTNCSTSTSCDINAKWVTRKFNQPPKPDWLLGKNCCQTRGRSDGICEGHVYLLAADSWRNIAPHGEGSASDPQSWPPLPACQSWSVSRGSVGSDCPWDKWSKVCWKVCKPPPPFYF